MRIKKVFTGFILILLLAGTSFGEIRLDPQYAAVEVGGSLLLRALPTGHGDIWWHSSDDSLVDLDVASDGISATVRAWKTGTSVVTVHFDKNGSGEIHSAECLITVLANADPYRVAGLRMVPESAVLGRGGSLHLTAIVVPETAHNKNIRWSTSNQHIASVTQQGIVRGASPGNVTISAVSEDGGFVAECEVSVVGSEVRVEGIILNHASLTVDVNRTRHLIAYIRPENATNKRVRWVTSNWNIASVSQTGIVVGVRRGRAVISAITEDGGFIAECVVRVRDGWLDFDTGCSAEAYSPFALLIALPLALLLKR